MNLHSILRTSCSHLMAQGPRFGFPKSARIGLVSSACHARGLNTYRPDQYNPENISMEQIRAVYPASQRRAKIICTLGPACWSVEGLTKLIDAGMNVARFNFSHGDHESHFATLQRLREAEASRPGTHVAVLLDTKGPEIRTGKVDPACGDKVSYRKGDVIEVGTDYDRPCTSQYLACSYKSLPSSVQPGGQILVADGALTLRVVSVDAAAGSVRAEVCNNASFGNTKNMNLPGAIVDLPTLTERDIRDLQQFGVKHQVDFVAASFVRKAGDIDFIREVLGEAGAGIKIIAKIENQEGMENFDQILARTDGIMVARGDLGMEIPLEKVFLAQKMMIRKCNIAGKPVVTATQMLESMIMNPRPTRAECADVANAILNGSDCLMLSGETANGDYPAEAVTVMGNTCIEAEKMMDYNAIFNFIREKTAEHIVGRISATESIASSAVKTASDLGSPLIVVVTQGGLGARLVAKYRPAVPVLVVTSSPQVARQVQGYLKNCTTQVVPSLHSFGLVAESAIAEAQRQGLCTQGDAVVCVQGGLGKEGKGGLANIMRIMEVK